MTSSIHSTLPSKSVKATLSMVAAKAGVSPSTVSRILNGTAQVNEAKKAQVLAAIEDLGFKPNLAARSLAGGRTMSVGVLTQFIDSPFYGEALRGIEDELRGEGYAPIFVSGHWDEKEEQNRLAMLEERNVDGIIVLTGKLSDSTLVEIAKTLPVVITGRQLEYPNLFSIDFDNIEGACLAVRHLHSLGHKEIAFISGLLDHPDAIQRLNGFKAEIKRKKLKVDEALIVYSDFQESGGFKAMSTLIGRGVHFTAVIAANDQMAYGARLALHRAGFHVPEDVSLIGFDDLPHSAFTLPPLTTVRQSIYEIGIAAAKAMLDLLKNKTPPSKFIEAELIVRESTRINRRYAPKKLSAPV
jgi:LacI family transcriptional regulator